MNLNDIKHLKIDGTSIIRLEKDDEVYWKGLPESYKRLDYIETNGSSTDTTYIDTGVQVGRDSRVVCEYMHINGLNCYGARNTTTSQTFAIRINVNTSGTNNLQHCYNKSTYVTTAAIGKDGLWHTIDQNKNLIFVDGVQVFNSTGVALEYPSTEFKTPDGIGFTLGRIRSTGGSDNYYGAGRFKSCKIYNEGVMVRDLIACQAPDGTAGMYDLLNAQFYANAGTGSFIVGELE